MIRFQCEKKYYMIFLELSIAGLNNLLENKEKLKKKKEN